MLCFRLFLWRTIIFVDNFAAPLKGQTFKRTWKKPGFFSINIRGKWKCVSVYHLSISLIHKYLLDNQKKIKSSRKEYVMWMCFKFWPMKNIFGKLYKPIRVWLWLVYKFNENNYCLRLFFKFIQTQKRYPTSLDKISILTWKLLIILSQNFSCELNSQRTYSLQNISSMSLLL